MEATRRAPPALPVLAGASARPATRLPDVGSLGNAPSPTSAARVTRRPSRPQHPEDHTSSGLKDSVHVLDTFVDPMVWTRPVLTGEAPGPRHGHAAVNVNDEIYFVGGFGDKGYYDSLHLLQLTSPAPPAPPSPPPPPG